MNLDEITPLILTFNEQANLRATLEGVSWAKQILLVDSGSSDDTLLIAKDFPQVKVVHRVFDHFADQCNYGIAQIETEWVLSLDADYKCDQRFADELSRLDDSADGFSASFLYGIYGKALRASLYPPRVVLYRGRLARYQRDGHAHRVQVDGAIEKLSTAILHDDWKPLSSWLAAQVRYAHHEAVKLQATPTKQLGWKDRIRKRIIFAAPLTLVYCLFYKRLLLDGWRGVFYSLQRCFAELVLCLVLIEQKLKQTTKS
jgi:glycosyltransferase involved in cell wall biosynthesis